MSDEILGRVEVADKEDNPRNLVFTSKRIIVALLVSELVAAVPVLSLLEMRKRREEYGRLSAESILKADKGNFAIPYEEIVNVEMKRPSTFGKGKVMIFSNKILLSSGEETKIPIVLLFTFKEKKNLFDERVNLVRSVLPDKLSVT